jgi:4-carboxymuconolactone decarboxylase
MTGLNERDRELVAIGAAVASNCIPCIAFHVGKGREAGLPDADIEAAVRLAEEIRAVPASLVVSTALAYLDGRADEPGGVARADAGECGCEQSTAASIPEDPDSCGCGC